VAIDEIYKEVILDHYRNPRNKRELPGAALTCTRNNPLCGDEIAVAVNVADDAISEIAFQGAGCSISQSSASMMTESVAGMPVDDALTLAADLRSMMAGELEPTEERFGELVALKGVVQYPIRIKCAVLAWDVLQEALDGLGSGAAEAAGTSPH
jgi:nitrogen fixation NifU-like protein